MLKFFICYYKNTYTFLYIADSSDMVGWQPRFGTKVGLHAQ